MSVYSSKDLAHWTYEGDFLFLLLEYACTPNWEARNGIQAVGVGGNGGTGGQGQGKGGGEKGKGGKGTREELEWHVQASLACCAVVVVWRFAESLCRHTHIRMISHFAPVSPVGF